MQPELYSNRICKQIQSKPPIVSRVQNKKKQAISVVIALSDESAAGAPDDPELDCLFKSMCLICPYIRTDSDTHTCLGLTASLRACVSCVLEYAGVHPSPKAESCCLFKSIRLILFLNRH